VVGGQEHAVKLGFWIMNQKGRRGTLTGDRLRALANVGVEWPKA
jgi:hypothetical protein